MRTEKPAGQHLKRSSSACTLLGHLLCAQSSCRTQWRLHLQRQGWRLHLPQLLRLQGIEPRRKLRDKTTATSLLQPDKKANEPGSTRPRLTAGTWSGRCTCTCPSNPVIGRRKLLADLAWVNNNPNKGEVDRQLQQRVCCPYFVIIHEYIL